MVSVEVTLAQFRKLSMLALLSLLLMCLLSNSSPGAFYVQKELEEGTPGLWPSASEPTDVSAPSGCSILAGIPTKGLWTDHAGDTQVYLCWDPPFYVHLFQAHHPT